MTAAKNRTSPEDVQEMLGIGKSQYYARIKKLGIKAHRDSDGKAYLDDEQMEKLMNSNNSGELAIAEVSELSLEIPLELQQDSSELEDEELSFLMREAQELRAQQAAMPDLVKLYLAAGIKEDELPEDLKQKVKAVRDAANPKQNAAAIASQLLERYRSGKR
jgi:hypothetical protein